jgi:molecular chaperone GrpE
MSQEDHKDEPAVLPPEPAADDAADVASADAAAAAPPDEIEQLRRQLQTKTEEANKNYDLFLRERAEVENFKKRMVREKSDALRFASEPLVRDLLPVVDNLERAVEHADGDGQSLVEGIRLVLKSLLEILERYGVKRVDAVGEQFDPARHEAMAQVDSPEHAPNQVVHQHHRGYLLHDRLLRPALVTVAGRKSPPAVESDSNSD